MQEQWALFQMPHAPCQHISPSTAKTINHLHEVSIRMVLPYNDEVATKSELLPGLCEVPAHLRPGLLLQVLHFVRPAQRGKP